VDDPDQTLDIGSSLASLEVTGRAILDGSLHQRGFEFTRAQLEDSPNPTYGSLFYRAEDQYLQFQVNTHWHDAPIYGSVALGVGGDQFPDSDWNHIALWRLARAKGADKSVAVYSLEGQTMRSFFLHALRDLIQYGQDFLDGELSLFFQLRKAQNGARPGYTVHAPGQTPVEMDISKELRTKYT